MSRQYWRTTCSSLGNEYGPATSRASVRSVEDERARSALGRKVRAATLGVGRHARVGAGKDMVFFSCEFAGVALAKGRDEVGLGGRDEGRSRDGGSKKTGCCSEGRQGDSRAVTDLGLSLFPARQSDDDDGADLPTATTYCRRELDRLGPSSRIHSLVRPAPLATQHGASRELESVWRRHFGLISLCDAPTTPPPLRSRPPPPRRPRPTSSPARHRPSRLVRQQPFSQPSSRRSSVRSLRPGRFLACSSWRAQARLLLLLMLRRQRTLLRQTS